MGPIDVSIVVPIFNEEENLEFLHAELAAIFKKRQGEHEIIYVDDGSTDESWNILRRISKDDKSVRILSFERNYGMTAALDAGFKHSKGDMILTIDGDLQYQPKDLIRIIQTLEEGTTDIVLGRRMNRNSGLWKRLCSWVATSVRTKVLGVHFQDCSLAGYRRKSLKGLRLFRGLQTFIPVLLQMEGCGFNEIEVREYPRKHGKSKYNFRNRSWKAFLALCAVKWMQVHRLDYKVKEDVSDENA